MSRIQAPGKLYHSRHHKLAPPSTSGRFQTPIFLSVLLEVFLLFGCGASTSNQGQSDEHPPGYVVGEAVAGVVMTPLWVLASPIEARDTINCGDPFYTVLGHSNAAGVSCGDYHAWRKAGFSKDEIASWAFLGLSPSEAAAWRQAGFAREDVRARPPGLSLDDAIKWRNAGFNMSQAASWSPHFSLDHAIKWRDAGFGADEATDYVIAYPAVTPGEARTLKTAGILVKECSDQKLSLDEALQWRKRGFSCAEASAWKEAGATADLAAKWKQAALPADTYYLAKQGVSPQAAAHWQAAGISLSNQSQTAAIRQFLASGYDLKWAIYYTSRGISPNQVGEYNGLNSICHGSYNTVVNLAYMSPFATSGKCFQLYPVVIQQWLTPTGGLASVGFGPLALVDFDQPPDKRVMAGVFVGEGAYQYESSDGSLETVPRLKWIGQMPGR